MRHFIHDTSKIPTLASECFVLITRDSVYLNPTLHLETVKVIQLTISGVPCNRTV